MFAWGLVTSSRAFSTASRTFQDASILFPRHQNLSLSQGEDHIFRLRLLSAVILLTLVFWTRRDRLFNYPLTCWYQDHILSLFYDGLVYERFVVEVANSKKVECLFYLLMIIGGLAVTFRDERSIIYRFSGCWMVLVALSEQGLIVQLCFMTFLIVLVFDCAMTVRRKRERSQHSV